MSRRTRRKAGDMTMAGRQNWVSTIYVDSHNVLHPSMESHQSQPLVLNFTQHMVSACSELPHVQARFPLTYCWHKPLELAWRNAAKRST